MAMLDSALRSEASEVQVRQMVVEVEKGLLLDIRGA